MDRDKVKAAIIEACNQGLINAKQREALLVVVNEHKATFGAVDWAKLLETLKGLLPIIAQLLPIILAIFAPKQVPPVDDNNPPVAIK